MRHAGGSRVEGLAVGDGEPVCGCQARLRRVEQVNAKGPLPFLAAGGLCHIVDAGLVRLVKRHHREWRSHDNRLLTRRGDRYAFCTWPGLNGDRSTGCNLSIAWNRRRQEPVDKIIDENGETRLQGQVRIVQVKTKHGYSPVIVLSGKK